MAIVAGFDVHRAQITFDALDERTGELERGRVRATPEAVRRWAARFAGDEVHVAVESCTGWLFVCEALVEAGAIPHLAEPVETRALRGRRRRAKTDREDARWLRTLLCDGRLPEAWIPPAHVREWRTRARLRKTLVDERTTWLQRVQATLFHHGVSGTPDKLLSARGREFLDALELPDSARERVTVSLAMIEALDRQLEPIEQALRRLARRQTGCRALMRHYGIGELTAPTILSELGDVTRLSASRKAVRCAGLDIGVHRSDRRSRVGKLTRQGSPQLRWALYESAQAACRPTSPDRADYLALKARGLSHTRASLTIARKLARRCFHTLRELGPDALEPVS
jgi:transposase